MLTTMGMDYLAGEVCTLLMELLTGGPCESAGGNVSLVGDEFYVNIFLGDFGELVLTF